MLISEEYVHLLGLHHKRFCEPYSAELAMEKNGNKVRIKFSDYVKLQLHDLSLYWFSKAIHTIIVPGLCVPIILGLSFLAHNNIVVDTATSTAIDNQCSFNLLHPVRPPT